jgi:hypothetical protein
MSKLTNQGENDRNAILPLSPALSRARNTYNNVSSSTPQAHSINNASGMVRVVCDSQVFIRVGNGGAVTASSSNYDHCVPAGIPYDIPTSQLADSSTLSILGDGATSNVRITEY